MLFLQLVTHLGSCNCCKAVSGHAFEQSRAEDRFCAGHRVCVLKREPWEQSPGAAGAGHAQEKGVSTPFSYFIYSILQFFLLFS